MDHAAACAAFTAESERFVATVREADPDTPVPTCAPWDIGRLVKHVGLIQRWAEQMVREGATERLDQRALDLALPEDRRAYPDWLAAGAAQLGTTLRAADPTQPTWSWGADQHARFWSRRALHEGTVHHADATLALGGRPSIDAAQAVDGIDEFLDNLPSAAAFTPRIAELRGTGESVHLHCTDTEGEWMITLTPDGFTWEHGHGKGTVAVRGRAEDLLLLAYGRLPAADGDRFARFGDTALLDRWITASAI
jgi:uncharacterized protein (TIGR03083 family)